MAHIKGYTYDIFISYAHVDNTPTSWENLGWIEKFYKDLDTLLTRRIGKSGVLKIWWDNKKLDGSVQFDPAIEEGIKQSAIIISLLSPSYLASGYCKLELETFYNKAKTEIAGLAVQNRSRLFNVLLYNIPFTEWPSQLEGTSGFSFHDAKEPGDYGDPIDTASLEFRNQLQNLRDAIIKLICDFPNNEQEPLPPVSEFTIYMSEVADSLLTTRKRTVTELEKKGYKIITGIPPPDKLEPYENEVKKILKQTKLSVHLFDQYPGKPIIDKQDISYPQKQAEVGLEFARSQLVWLPSDLDLETIEEEEKLYRLFLERLEKDKKTGNNFEFVRGNKSMLAQQIADFAEQVKAQQAAPVNGIKTSVLIDTHFNDQLYALDLSKDLLKKHIQPFINPQEDDPRKNINILADRIRQVSKLFFLYGQVSKDWVLERMSAALQLIITNNYPIEEFVIYLYPPEKDPNEILLKQKFLNISVIDNSRNS